ncbi:diphthamide synthesis protein [Vulcanisaeta thermophila]|uniref:diphthamide synthesis protein n=1 Tax=Vulcanisaeta thermophila TaxID=867917 RepID=UPI000A640E77|nr:diphthamide synthesis protein [Vulcanisaeta thermophila]
MGNHYEELAGFLIPLSDIIDSLKNARHVLVEVPLGMRELGLELTKYLVSNGFDALMSARNVWGACDFLVTRDYDAVLHVGHALPPNIRNIINANHGIEEEVRHGEVEVLRLRGGETVVFAPAYYKPHGELLSKLSGELKSLVQDDSIIAYSLPYRLFAEALSGMLNAKLAPSAITGCFVGYPIPNVVFFVGSGYFYPLTFKLLKPSARVYLVDVFRQVIEDVEPLYRRALAAKVNNVGRVMEGRRVAIVITRKPGQRRLDLLSEVQGILRSLGKDFVVVEGDELSPDALDNLPVDGIINTACPRIGIDDLDRFIKPVINARDLMRGDLLGNLLGW